MPDQKEYEASQVLKLNFVEGRTEKETAKILGVAPSAVTQIKKTETFHQMAVRALEDSGSSPAKIAKQLSKTIHGENTPANVKFNAIKLACDIFGLQASKDESEYIKNLTDDALEMALSDAENRTKRYIKYSPSGEADEETPGPVEEEVGGRTVAGEQGECPVRQDDTQEE